MPTPVQTDQVYSADKLTLEGQNGARLNSPKGSTTVVGQDVSIIGQDGAGAAGNVTVDAVGTAKLQAGKKVKIAARRIDLLAEVLVLGVVHEDPENPVPWQVWVHSGDKVIRYYDGVKVRTLRTV